jgi:hypothetical protein
MKSLKKYLKLLKIIFYHLHDLEVHFKMIGSDLGERIAFARIQDSGLQTKQIRLPLCD